MKKPKFVSAAEVEGVHVAVALRVFRKANYNTCRVANVKAKPASAYDSTLKDFKADRVTLFIDHDRIVKDAWIG